MWLQMPLPWKPINVSGIKRKKQLTSTLTSGVFLEQIFAQFWMKIEAQNMLKAQRT